MKFAGHGRRAALRRLGKTQVWHMNEAFGFLELERALELVARQNLREAAAVIRKTNVFTTHTPVPAATTVPAVAGG